MTSRLAANLVMLITPAAVAAGQLPTTKPTWVDTVTVERLPTGSCHWSSASARMRPGKPGTTTMPGPTNEKTCTVLFSNYTTGGAADRPALIAFSYMEDRTSAVPKGAVLNFADTFTVARRPDGTCDWSKTPVRQGKPGSSSYLAEVRVTRCWGVVHNLTYARTIEAPLKADSVVFRGLSDDELLADMKATSALLKQAHVSENDVVRTGRGKNDAVIVIRLPKGEAHYTFAKTNGVWAITRVDTVPAAPKPDTLKLEHARRPEPARATFGDSDSSNNETVGEGLGHGPPAARRRQ